MQAVATSGEDSIARSHSVVPLDAPDLDAALSALREHGLRVSAARRLVLDALYRAEDPLTAEQVAAGALGPRADLASVYRNLETLEGLGLVRHFHLGHGPGLYVRAGAPPREYLVCDSCGEVKAVPPAKLDAARRAVGAATGWEARFDHFPVSGLCPRCSP
ncbi:MAG: transcriptional repressor [Thermoleophilaceae bacterium]|nr:transcriptional repressor [Thermoleophilaceae bacterium]